MATVDPSNGSRSHLRRQESDGVATLLRQARERRGLTLEQVAHETKVPLERLAALEQYGLSGGSCGFYQRARIRAYARAVHIDDRELLDVLEREAPPPAPAPVQPQRARRRSSRGQHLVTLVACGVIVVSGAGVRGAATGSSQNGGRSWGARQRVGSARPASARRAFHLVTSVSVLPYDWRKRRVARRTAS